MRSEASTVDEPSVTAGREIDRRPDGSGSGSDSAPSCAQDVGALADASPPPPGSMREALLEVWEYRHLLYQFTNRDIRIRYKQAAMGFAWAIFMPIVIVLAGVVVRYAMARLSGSELVTAHISGMAVKAVGWSFFVGALGFSVNSLTGNMTLVSKVYFPREILPLSATTAQAFDTVVGTAALAAVLPLLGVDASLQLLWVPPIAAILFLFTASLGVFLSCANLFFRDVKYIVRVLITFGIFFTPVFFEPSDFGALGARVMMLNPLAPMLEGLRLAVVEAHPLTTPLAVEGSDGASTVLWTPWYLVYSVAFTLVAAAASVRLFHRAEFKFAEYV